MTVSSTALQQVAGRNDRLASVRCISTLDTPFFRAKLLLDRSLALLMLVPALPVIGILILLIRLTSKGPGIYSQLRVGKGGKTFCMLKLRSMRVDAEAASGPTWASLGRDPRVTFLGHWLRLLHLDELPQLFNVLKGEMSLVGPRPERPEFVRILEAEIPGYLDRLQVAPGITGLAQINLPPDSDLNSVRRKLMLDCEYIRSANFALDLRILASTMLRMFGLRGGKAVRWFGLLRKVDFVGVTVVANTSSHSTGSRVITPGDDRAAVNDDENNFAEPSAAMLR